MKAKCVLVDDSRDTLDVLSLLFSTYQDVEITATARSASEAMEICQSEQIDMISIDIHLAGDSGFDLCNAIHNKYPDVFITMCSLESDTDYRQHASAAGAHYFLAKPVSSYEMDCLLTAYYDHRTKTQSDGIFDQDGILGLLIPRT